MQTIIPAILESDFTEIKRKFDLVKNECELIQIDVCDGEFVSSKTWPFNQDSNPYKLLQDIYYEANQIELDVMVNNPDVEQLLAIPFKQIVVHVQSISDEMKGLFIESDPAKRYSKIGFALPSDFSHIESNRELILKSDFIQVMGIKNIGKQHEPFDSSCLDTIKKLRSEFPEIVIQVDGGMNETIIPLVFAAGANRAVVGSSVFGNGNPVENLRNLEKIAEESVLSVKSF